MKKGEVRIIKLDDKNWVVQTVIEVKVKETGEVRLEWGDNKYYGDHLDWALSSALILGYPEERVELIESTLNRFLVQLLKASTGLELKDIPKKSVPPAFRARRKTDQNKKSTRKKKTTTASLPGVDNKIVKKSRTPKKKQF